MTWIVLAFPVVLMLVALSLEQVEAVLLDPPRPPTEGADAAGAPAAAEHDLPTRTAAALSP